MTSILWRIYRKDQQPMNADQYVWPLYIVTLCEGGGHDDDDWAVVWSMAGGGQWRKVKVALLGVGKRAAALTKLLG